MQRVDLKEAVTLSVTADNSPIILMGDWTVETARMHFINADGSIGGEACQTGDCNKCPAGKMFEDKCWYLPANEKLDKDWFINSDKSIADGGEEI